MARSDSSSVLMKFISPETAPGKFFVDFALPGEWKPRLVPSDSIWSMEFRRHSSAFIAVELGNFMFDRFHKMSIDEARAAARPIGAWMCELPRVELWDQIGAFDRNLGHWHFLYRDNKITGSLDVFLFPKTERTSMLFATITEHVSFR